MVNATTANPKKSQATDWEIDGDRWFDYGYFNSFGGGSGSCSGGSSSCSDLGLSLSLLIFLFGAEFLEGCV